MRAVRRLGVVLLVLASAGVAHAGPDQIAPLLKTLDLRAYAPATMPPAFSGHTPEDRDVSLAKLRGKVVVVNFWASWCLECRPEMPVLEALHRASGARGLAIIGVNVRETAPTVRRYAKELDLTFPLVMDPAGTINALYGVVGLPTTFVIGRDGRAVAFGVGPRAWGSAPAHALLDTLLSEPPSAR